MKLTKEKTISELIESYIREDLSIMKIEEKKIIELINRDKENWASDQLNWTIEDIAYKLQSSNTDSIDDLFVIIQNLKIYALKDILFTTFNNTIIEIDFSKDLESTIWERFFNCYGIIGYSDNWTQIYETAVRKCNHFFFFSNEKHYNYFTFSFIRSLLRINFRYGGNSNFKLNEEKMLSFFNDLCFYKKYFVIGKINRSIKNREQRHSVWKTKFYNEELEFETYMSKLLKDKFLEFVRSNIDEI